jgi:tRNA (uracil-5-)-methyltransferase TRM9
MDLSTATKLIELNRQFYQTFGKDFSATRGRIQPGVRQILSVLEGTERLLDLGCGNGELARELVRVGFRGSYLGIDFSLPLLRDAASQPDGFSASFLQADLTGDWESLIHNDMFDLVFCFATLHHIPGEEIRQSILQKIHSLLKQNGKFILSNWQFLNSEKLKSRIQSWSQAGISPDDVDGDDYLLDWRAGGKGLRYAHHFSEEELESLAARAGFRVFRSFYSYGENGRLGLYQVWEAE